jgi:hypothetical protein
MNFERHGNTSPDIDNDIRKVDGNRIKNRAG